MTERRAGEPIVDPADEAGRPPFGGYSVETETMPDGRRIRYYSWPAEPEADREPGEPRETAPGT